MDARTYGRRPLLLLSLVVLAGTLAFADPPSFRIETETGRSQFPIGEAIGVRLIFETVEPDIWRLALNGRDRSVLGFGRDRFVVSPATAVSDPWDYRRHEGMAYSGPGGMVLHNKTTQVDVDLNQWVRFERPGQYRVRAAISARTGRFPSVQQAPVELESNVIEIEILQAENADSAERLGHDVAVLRSALDQRDNQAFERRMNAARRISYLDTPASVQAMARLIGDVDSQSKQILLNGLRSSRLQAEVATALRTLFDDPNQPVTTAAVEITAATEAAQRFPLSANESNEQSRQRVEARATAVHRLINELPAVIGKKRGRAKAITIKTAFDYTAGENVPATLRSQLAGVFLELPVDQQSELLDSGWKRLAGPEMIPALRQISGSLSETAGAASPLIAAAVERLSQLDPQNARALLMDEIARPAPRLPFRVLALLPDATLPETEQSLLKHLEENQPAEELIARYATVGVLAGVTGVYRRRDAAMRGRSAQLANGVSLAAPACEPALVAYFLRVEPVFGEQVIRDLLSARDFPMGRCWTSILGSTAKYPVGAAWEKIAIEALNDPTVVVKGDAARALGLRGSFASGEAVREAFRYWHDWWRERPGEMNDENRRFEQILFEALAHPGGRAVTPDDLAALNTYCITSNCKAQADAILREKGTR